MLTPEQKVTQAMIEKAIGPVTRHVARLEQVVHRLEKDVRRLKSDLQQTKNVVNRLSK